MNNMSSINKENINSKYILENPESFNLKHIFECGQCFRWNFNKEDNSYIGIVEGNVIKVLEEKEIIDGKEISNYIFTSTIKNNEDLEKLVYRYFDLNRKYTDIKEEILEKNSLDILGICKPEDKNIIEHNMSLKEAIDYGYGIRILKQDLWETVVTYIISANNNIPRIKGIIERLALNYGREIEFENKKYYSFPTPEELSKASVQDLRDLGLGFRDKRVYDIAKVFLENKEKFLDLNQDSSKLKTELMKYNGIGPKVADCILLFALSRFEIFPVDVWVRRVMNDIYFKKSNEKQLTNDEILKFVNRKYGDYAGIVQQYLFYWKRETHE